MSSGNSCFSRLFPTSLSFFIFASYVGLSISLGILVTNSQQKNNGYSYNVTTVVLFVELVKLLAALLIYLTSNTMSTLAAECLKYKKVLILYLVPGALYCLYNNLAFINLSSFDPTTYFLLMQLRVLVTGVMYQMLFKRYLTRMQWLALLVLTVGCVVKQLDLSSGKSTSSHAASTLSSNTRVVILPPGSQEGEDSQLGFGVAFSLLLVLVQILCSCLASVFNERLLKGHSGQASLSLQNIFMYADSSLCNLTWLLFTGDLVGAFSPHQLGKIVLVPSVLVVVLNNAALGLVTSVFLKTLNSILKVFAWAIEPVLLAALCFVIFGYRITGYTVVSITLVTGATLLYAHQPLAMVTAADATSELPSALGSEKASKRDGTTTSVGAGGVDTIPLLGTAGQHNKQVV